MLYTGKQAFFSVLKFSIFSLPRKVFIIIKDALTYILKYNRTTSKFKGEQNLSLIAMSLVTEEIFSFFRFQ